MLSWALIESLSGDSDFSYVPIQQASFSKKVVYLCPECFSEVRPRKGLFKRSHFFHLSSQKKPCRKSAKKKMGHLHKNVQQYIKRQLKRFLSLSDRCSDSGQVELEKIFSDINRIADVAFIPLRIIFEVQISPIHPKEILERTINYNQLGWHVIWILYDKVFLSSDTTVADILERAHVPHYYVGYGKGISKTIIIYDMCAKKTALRDEKIVFNHLYPICLQQDPSVNVHRLYGVLAQCLTGKIQTRDNRLAMSQGDRQWSVHIQGDLREKQRDNQCMSSQQSSSLSYLHLQRANFLQKATINSLYQRLCEYLLRWWLLFLSKR